MARSCGEDYHINAVDRQILQNGQLGISGARRHVDDQIVQIAPNHFFPELFDNAGNDRTSPNNRFFVVRLWSQVRSKKELDTTKWMGEVVPHDLVKYGLIPELVGRLPVITALDGLDQEPWSVF